MTPYFLLWVFTIFLTGQDNTIKLVNSQPLARDNDFGQFVPGYGQFMPDTNGNADRRNIQRARIVRNGLFGNFGSPGGLGGEHGLGGSIGINGDPGNSAGLGIQGDLGLGGIGGIGGAVRPGANINAGIRGIGTSENPGMGVGNAAQPGIGACLSAGGHPSMDGSDMMHSNAGICLNSKPEGQLSTFGKAGAGLLGSGGYPSVGGYPSAGGHALPNGCVGMGVGQDIYSPHGGPSSRHNVGNQPDALAGQTQIQPMGELGTYHYNGRQPGMSNYNPMGYMGAGDHSAPGQFMPGRGVYNPSNRGAGPIPIRNDHTGGARNY